MNSNKVLDFFKEITKIPRESGHEEPMTDYLIAFAKERKLEYKKDSCGNVLITKAASQSKEHVPTIVLQCHQDMVCEKSETCTHDFSKDPIKYVIKDGWMIAEDTTLGADDGIGIAACLALLDSDLDMGCLECLFTISEETGMDGANALEQGFFNGKTLINLDSEDEGQLFVGCAGGISTMAKFTYENESAAAGSVALSFRLFNAMGGHSGDDINKERMNTVQQMARFLYDLSSKIKFQLVSINGGGKHNAIARECTSVILLSPEVKEVALHEFEDFFNALKNEFQHSDPNVMSEVHEQNDSLLPIDSAVAEKLISALVAVHHGVLSMSQDIPGLVETSNNLASVKFTEPGVIEVCTSQRSSVDSAKRFIADKVESCFRLAGAQTKRSDPYPGWKPDLNSKILKQTVESYRHLFNQEPLVKAIHAGLECGLFLEKFNDLDMISFGPTLRGVHAPGERLDLASNEKFVDLLVDVVTNFS